MNLRVKLEYETRVIQQSNGDDLADNITIGRSRECDWVVPSEDSSIGRKHVRLFKKKNALFLEDLGSQNGTFLDKKRIKGPVKLRAGQRINFGRCVLVVEKVASAEKAAGFCPCLQVVNGSKKGFRVDIGDKGVRIGSDPESDLVLLDDLLVSRSHAFVGCNEGSSCWIEDCGSTNGTRVDGEALVPNRKRPLKPGNTIQVAHVDILFTDATALERKSRFLKALGVVALCLGIAYALFFMFQLIKPPVPRILAEARTAAERERFQDAVEILSNATGRSDYHRFRAEVEELRSLISAWQTTASFWRRAERTLLDQDLWSAPDDVASSDSARRLAEDLNQLCTLLVASRNWEWNPKKGPLYLAQAQMAKQLMDGIFSINTLMRSADLNTARLEMEVSRLRAADASVIDPDTVQLLNGLQQTANYVAGEAELLLQTMHKMESLLQRLAGEWPPPLHDVLGEWVDLLHAHSAVSSRARSIHPVIEKLNDSYIELGRRMDAARSVRFEDGVQPVSLPPRDLCARHPALSELRDRLDRASQSVRSQTMRAQVAYNQTSAALNGLGGARNVVRRWSDPEIMNVLIRYDCLEGPHPRRSRTEPSSIYDEIVGVEHMYSILRGEQPEMEFWKPEIFRLAAAFRLADTALADFLRDDFRWMIAGQMGEHVKDLMKVIDMRSELTKRLREHVSLRGGRDALLAAGMLLVIAETPGQITVDEVALDEWGRLRLGELRSKLLSLDREYPMASPDRQIEIREEILRVGLPGDPIVRQYWLRRPL